MTGHQKKTDTMKIYNKMAVSVDGVCIVWQKIDQFYFFAITLLSNGVLFKYLLVSRLLREYANTTSKE